MPLITISTLDHPDLAIYSQLTEAQLRNRLRPTEGLFLSESPKVIHTALAAGYTPVSLLCEDRHILGDAAHIIAQCPDIPVYTGSRELLRTLTGYSLTRGVLCAMRRRTLPTVESICSGSKRIAVIHGVVDTTNIGTIFRAAAALGIDGVLLTTDTCDPLNRRAVRVSMGSVFLIPWTWLEAPLHLLHTWGYRTVAMALTPQALSIDDTRLQHEERLAIVLGTEGDGLPPSVIAACDYIARIPMNHQVDSLNVGAAAAVAFWELRVR